MFLIQILLPRVDNDGTAFPPAVYRDITGALTKRFGGVTAYARAPAEGSWESDDGGTHHDDVVIVEVMAQTLDENWWTAYRQQLRAQFRQRELVVRAQPITVL